jgi:thioredoxin reductase
VYDVAIVGGGPAGLSAALILGRCRRRVLLCDAGKPRNRSARAMHGYLTRDGVAPLEFLRIAGEELGEYAVERRAVSVTDIVCTDDGFRLTLDTGDVVDSRTTLIATGVADNLPKVPGIEECYGVTVHHCPYCDGWEERDRAVVVIGNGAAAAALALSLKIWTQKVTVCPNGRPRLTAQHRQQLAGNGIAVREGTIARVEHERGHVNRVVFTDGGDMACESIFFTLGQRPQCDLPRRLGCELTKKGVVKTDHLGLTCVPGLYVAGDASRDVQFVIVAAAEGAKAGVAINKALQARAGLAVEPVRVAS